jgi:hypothetical protein
MDRAAMFEGEARKYKEEYARICDVLKSKINDTINNTVSRRWAHPWNKEKHLNKDQSWY